MGLNPPVESYWSRHKKLTSFSLSCFVPCRPTADWTVPAYTESRTFPLSPLIPMLISFRSHLPDKPRSDTLPVRYLGTPYFSPVDAGRCSVYLRFQSAFQIYFVVFGLSYDCVCILIRGCIGCENCSCLTPKHIFLRLILSYLAFKHLYVYKHKNGLIHSSGSPSYIYT